MEGTKMEMPPNECAGFALEEQRELPDRNATAYLYRNKKHGCPFLSIQCNDENNFFSVIVRTPALDNSGSTHMLEHMILDGSRTYPVNSILFELSKRSYANFMNAFTDNETTVFPFSSCNKYDFFNILNIYLDSVFHPCLREIDFLNECHRLEFVDGDRSKSLIHTGVVYNEMCGALSDPSRQFFNGIMNHLYPDSATKFISGGIPSEIAKMTVDDIRKQHKKFYHPSNCLFFHYGSLNIDEILSKIASVIEPFTADYVGIDTNLLFQPHWDKPRSAVMDIQLPPGSTTDDCEYRVCVCWLVSSVSELEIQDDLALLLSLLTTTNNSPIYQAVIDGKNAKSLENASLDSSIRCPNFTIGASGMTEEQANNFDGLILKTLNEVYEEGFDPNRVNALIHQWELHLRIVNENPGFSILNEISGPWPHGVNPIDIIDDAASIERMKENFENDPRYFEDMMKKMLIDNTHRLFIIARPSSGIEEKKVIEEQEGLESILKELTEAQAQKILFDAEAVKSIEKPVEMLPTFRREFLVEKGEEYLPDLTEDGVSVFIQPTNGITSFYVKGDIPVNHPFIRLFPYLTACIGEVGAGDLGENELSMFLETYTDALEIEEFPAADPDDPSKTHARFVIGGMALDENAVQLSEAIEMIVLEPHLDNAEGIETILTGLYQWQTGHITSSGDVISRKRSTAPFNEHAALNEMWSGLTSVQTLGDIVNSGDWEGISSSFQDLYKKVMMNTKFSMAIHCTKQQKKKALMLGKQLIRKLNRKASKFELDGESPITELMMNMRKNDKLYIGADLSAGFTSTSVYVAPFADPRSPVVAVLAEIIENEFLTGELREKLGAYGFSCNFIPWEGTMSITSIRDRCADKILEAIHGAIETIADGEVTKEMVDRSVIQVFSQMDSPSPPTSRGITTFRRGVSEEILQRRRSTVFSATKEEVVELAKEVLMKPWHTCILSNESVSAPPDGFTVISVSSTTPETI